MNSHGMHLVIDATLLGQKKYPKTESKLLRGNGDKKQPGSSRWRSSFAYVLCLANPQAGHFASDDLLRASVRRHRSWEPGPACDSPQSAKSSDVHLAGSDSVSAQGTRQSI
jgi:hypothetical protein